MEPEGAAVGPDGVLHGQEPEVVEPQLAQEVGERPPVVLRRSPDEPTAEERASHNILHEPYRSWCRSCGAGRGRADRHTLRAPEEKGLPIVGVDYGYLYDRSEEDVEEGDEHADPEPNDTTSNPILAGRSSRDRWIVGHLFPQKGNVAWNREVLSKELLDGGYKRQVIRSDGEPALWAHINGAITRTLLDNDAAEVVREVVSRGQSAANGLAEGAVKEIKANVRTLRHSAEAGLRQAIPDTAPCLSWLVAFAGVTINITRAGVDGRTAYELRYDRAFR